MDKKQGRIVTAPWSYRNGLFMTMIICSLAAALISFNVSFFIERGKVRQEAGKAQDAAAALIRELASETDLSVERICVIAASESVTVQTAAADESGLTVDRLDELARVGMLRTAAERYAMPETWLSVRASLIKLSSPYSGSLLLTVFARIITSFAFYVLFFSIACLLAAGYMARPVHELTDAMRKVAGGDFSIRLSGTDPGEIGDLKRSFNVMSEALGRADYVQKDFIGNISHEFRTPIAAIKGYARLLQINTLDEASREDYVQMIAQESDRLANMARTLLRLSSLEQQDQTSPAQITAFRLDEQLREIIAGLAPVWEEKNIDWQLELRPVTIRSDEALLAQVWTNIIQNAVRYSHDGGAIRVAVYDAGEAVTEIRDHGTGMEAETLRRIFDRFYQADPSRSQEGAGLGLTLAKRIVEILGGSIRAASAPNEGSTFLVRLPLDYTQN